MRIMYLTQWFDPEPGVIKGPEFVNHLISSGFDIDVVTGVPNYPGGQIYKSHRIRLFQSEQMKNFEVYRLPLFPSHDKSALKRALNYLSFFLSSLIYGLWSARRYDAAYVYHPPITVGLSAALFCGFWKKPFILEIQDLWPDTVAASGMANSSRTVKILNGLCNFVYRRANQIIVQSAGMRTALLQRGVPSDKLHVVRNWADSAALCPVVLAPDDNASTRRVCSFVYGGNLGKAQALHSFIRAAQKVAEQGFEISVTLIGTGVEENALKRMVTDEAISNVQFLSRVPKEEIGAHFAAADCLIMHLADLPLFTITLPSKTQFYLASGRPIIAAVSGEAAEILDASGAAMVVRPENVDSIAEAMIAMARKSNSEREKMGKLGLQYYHDTFSFEKGVSATGDVINLLRK